LASFAAHASARCCCCRSSAARSRVENACRKLNVAQLVVAAPGVLLGGAAYVWYLSQGA
jgi:hypothetical protein